MVYCILNFVDYMVQVKRKLFNSLGRYVSIYAIVCLPLTGRSDKKRTEASIAKMD